MKKIFLGSLALAFSSSLLVASPSCQTLLECQIQVEKLQAKLNAKEQENKALKQEVAQAQKKSAQSNKKVAQNKNSNAKKAKKNSNGQPYIGSGIPAIF
ncbi:hypothetical protein OFO01_07730 [Campylobacter sp. JMF_01 NE2]|uniref:hypothetical protein n=1 Tax=unclassified Campylobacter TaxID=2593542 RepID=UPI0022E9A147|nr:MULTISPECIES: hypothetical protein [unclassified Campylobacter]MDA3053307.1 hypothetical protein [Campylobacter sp. JMF_03 NE3]MDA3067673.1 hypothetical protein [Campylobacter sp. JMF_01 NE2]